MTETQPHSVHLEGRMLEAVTELQTTIGRHALTKTTRGTDRAAVARVLTSADRLLAAIPEDRRDFDAAKADVMAQSSL
jgi:hypothetical protein